MLVQKKPRATRLLQNESDLDYLRCFIRALCIGTVAVANELEHMLLQRHFFGWQGSGGISRVERWTWKTAVVLLMTEIRRENHLGCIAETLQTNGISTTCTSTGELIPDFRDPSTVPSLKLT